LGLILAAGTGLSVGREGPFVHMAGVMAYQLLFRVPHFKDILENEGLFRQMLVSSTSLGIGATFAALIGGVLFTIEITSTYYLVAQYFKGFVAGLSGALAVICLDSLMTSQERAKQTLVLSAFTSDMYDLREMPAYFFIGCMCAALGQLYKHQRLFLLKYIRIMTSWNLRLARNPAQRWQFVRRTVIVSSSVAFISSMLMFFPGEYNRSGPFALFQDLISAGDLPDSFTSAAGGQNVALLLVFIMRWITSSLATSIVVPAGDFILLAGVGAAGGRLFGNMINHFYSGTFPATYALIGGAALSASATQSISSGLIILELTGASTMTIPTFVAVLAAVGFSRKLGRNLYDSVMETNGLKTLQGLNPDPEYIANRTASNIMVRDLAVVPCDSTVEYLVNRLEDVGKFVRFPVVSSLDTLVFQGVVDRGELARLLRRRGSRNNRFMSHVNKRLGQDMAAISTESQSNVFSISVALHSVYDTIKTIGRGAQQEEGDTGSISPTSQRTRRGRPKLTSLFESPNSTQRARSPLRMKSQRLSLAALEHGGWEEKNLKEAVMADMMRARVDLVSEWQNGGIYIDTSVWTVPENMPLGHLHVLFELLKATEVFVVDSSQLRGVITRDVLYEALRGSRPNSSYYYS
jgi:H+/Cl- antiporter ClcA